MKQYKILTQLSSNKRAKVFFAHERTFPKAMVILKLLPHIHANQTMEAQIMKLCKPCKNIANLVETHVNKEAATSTLVMEYCGVTLEALVNSWKVNLMPPYINAMGLSFLYNLMLDVFSGLDFMHNTLKVVHRDIQPRNICCNNRFVLIDMGCSGSLSYVKKNFIGGPFPYLPPETIRDEQCKVYGYPSDVWSAGMVVLEVYHGVRLYFFTSQKGGLKFFGDTSTNLPEKLLDCINVLPESIRGLFVQILHMNPNRRFTAKEVCTYLLKNKNDFLK
jgi:serine/threonine protein kinase